MSLLSKIFGSDESLGIDLGSGSVKVVALGYKDKRWILKNYGQVRFKKENPPAAKKILELSDQQIADLIKTLLKKMKVRSKEFFASLPMSAGFSTIITLPKMSKSELAAAVMNEAEKYIPVSLDDTIIDWAVIPSGQDNKKPFFSKDRNIKNKKVSTNSAKIISVNQTAGKFLSQEDIAGDDNNQTQQKILLVSVLKEVANRYQNIFNLAGLKIIGWEEESFSLGRSLIGDDKKMYLLIDLGYADISSFLINNGLIRFTYNFKAREREDINSGLQQVISLAKEKYHYQISNIVLTGGRLVADRKWVELLKTSFPLINFTLGDPLARVVVLPQKQEQAKKVAPLYAVAIGLAMKKEQKTYD